MQMDQPGGEYKFLTLKFFGLLHTQNRAVSFVYKIFGIIAVHLVSFVRKRSLSDGQVRNEVRNFLTSQSTTCFAAFGRGVRYSPIGWRWSDDAKVSCQALGYEVAKEKT